MEIKRIKFVKIFLIFALLVLQNIVLNARTPLSKAENFYKDRNFEAAAKQYENLIANGYESPELYYNLGNTYYRLGRNGLAILYYEKALRLSPGDEDIQYNLKIVNAHTADKIEVLPELEVIRFFKDIPALFTVNGWTVISLYVYLVMIILLIVTVLSKEKRLKQIFRISALSSGLLLFTAVLMLFVRWHTETSVTYGVVIEAVSTVKTEPDNQSRDAFVIHEGLKAEIDDSVQDWKKIRLPDGKSGWISEKDIRII